MITLYNLIRSKTITFVVISTLLAITIGSMVYHFFIHAPLTFSELENIGCIVFKKPRYFSMQNIIDHNNSSFGKERLLNKWSLLYFGYTSCPDICPATLSQLNMLDKTLKQSYSNIAKRFQYIMVSIDPKRDTAKQLSQYIPYFNDSFIGLTGELENIHSLTQQFNIPTVFSDNSRNTYTVDHSANLIIINPRGDYHGYIVPLFSLKKLVSITISLVLNTNL